MKKEAKMYTMYKEVYVSVDGKEFGTEKACRRWEESYRGTLEASWKLIPKVPVDATELGLPWSHDDDECYLLTPKDFDEITLLNAYIQDTCSSDILTTNHIGKSVVLNFGTCGDICDIYILEDHVDRIINYAEKLKAKLKEMTEVKEIKEQPDENQECNNGD